MKKKIGIYSGVFDPIHHGHINFAQKAHNQLGLDKIYFMAEPKPRRKASPSDVRHRLNMLWLALKDFSHLELLPLDHHVFTVSETLPWLETKFKDAELHLLMGTDLFNFVHTWPGFDSLKHRAKFVVGQRAGQSSAEVTSIPHHSITTELAELASSKVRLAHPREHLTMVPEPVAQYISAQNLYQS